MLSSAALRAAFMWLCLAWFGLARASCCVPCCAMPAQPGRPPSRLPLAAALRLRGGCSSSSSEAVEIPEDEEQKKRMAKDLRRRRKRESKAKQQSEEDGGQHGQAALQAAQRCWQGPCDSTEVEGGEVRGDKIQTVRYCDGCGVPKEFCAYVGCATAKKTSPRGVNTANATDARADYASTTMQASVEALGNLSLSGAHPQLQQEQAPPRDKPPPSERKGHPKKAAEKAKVRSEVRSGGRRVHNRERSSSWGIFPHH